MDITKGTGPHSVPPKIIKEISQVIVHPIAIICNKSFTAGVYPNLLKLSQDTNIQKRLTND